MSVHSSGADEADSVFDIDEDDFIIDDSEVIRIKQNVVMSVDDVRMYSDDRLLSEVKTLLQVDLAQYFARRSYYERQLRAFARGLKHVSHSYEPSTVDVQFTKAAYPVVELDRVLLTEGDDEGREAPSAGRFLETLGEHLHSRKVLARSNDVPAKTEGLLTKLYRPHTVAKDADSTWVVTMSRDTDCVLLHDDALNGIHELRLIGPTVWWADTGAITVDAGDSAVLRGIHVPCHNVAADAAPAVDVFDLDMYLDALSTMNVGEKVVLAYHDGTRATGQVKDIDDSNINIVAESGDVVAFSYRARDAHSNAAFVYSASFKGPKYQKSRLGKDTHWTFLVKDTALTLDKLRAWILPCAGDRVSHLTADNVDNARPTSCAELERMLQTNKLGSKGSQAVKGLIAHGIKDFKTVVCAEDDKKKQTKPLETVTPHVPDFLQFFKHRKTLERYHSPYKPASTLAADGDRVRFQHIRRSVPRLYAYCLDLTINGHLNPSTKRLWEQKLKDISSKKGGGEEAGYAQDGGANDPAYKNFPDLLLRAPAPNQREGTEAFVAAWPGHPPRVYRVRNGTWAPLDVEVEHEPKGAAILSDGTVAYAPAKAEAEQKAKLAANQVDLLEASKEYDVDKARVLAVREIRAHLATEACRSSFWNPKELASHEKKDWTSYVGNPDDEDAFRADVVPENHDSLVPTYDVDTGGNSLLDHEMMNEPIGAVLALIVELFRVDLPSVEVQAIYYNVVRSREFEEHRAQLRDKEAKLRKQAMRFKTQAAAAVSGSQLETTLRNRLAQEENAFLTAFYSETVAMIIAQVVVHVQAALPHVAATPVMGIAMPLCQQVFSLRGYPLDMGSEGPSLITYMSCVLTKLGKTMPPEAPLARAVKHFGRDEAMAAAARGHIAQILLQMPHYELRIQRARAAIAKKSSNHAKDKADRQPFHGFRPASKLPASIAKHLPSLRTADLVLVDAVTGSVKPLNRCCAVQLSNAADKQTSANKRGIQEANKHTTFNQAKTKKQRTQASKIVVEHPKDIVKHVQATVHGVSNTIYERMGYAIKAFVAANHSMYSDDTHFGAISKTPDDSNAWAALSVTVSLGWQGLMSSIKVPQSDVAALNNLFVTHTSYADAFELRRIMLQFAGSILPGFLGRAGSGTVPSGLHIERKKWISPGIRKRLADNQLDSETRFVLDMLHARPGIAHQLQQAFSSIAAKTLASVHELELTGCPASVVHRNVLLINYVILKAMHCLLHASFGPSFPKGADMFDRSRFDSMYVTNIDARNIAELMRMLLNRARTTATAVHVDLEEIRSEFEVQREHVKQDIIKKMERLTREEKNAFRIMRERIGFSHHYLDPFQAAQQLISEARVLEQEDKQKVNLEQGADDIASAHAAQEDQDNNSMRWEGENPDEIEIDDDGSGY